MTEDVVIIQGNVIVKEISKPIFEWSGKADDDRELVFNRAYEIAPPYLGEGISNMVFRVHNREFKDLSFLNGETLQEYPHHNEIRKHADGTKFMFSYNNIPTFDSGDREWDSAVHITVYADESGINLIHCRHGYKVPRIKVYIGLQKSIPAFTEWLEKLENADQDMEKSIEEAALAWSQHVHTVVRLAFTGAIYKKDDHYCIAMKDQTLELVECPTLVDVYLYIHRQDEEFKKKTRDLYNDEWSMSFVVDLVQHAEKHLDRMEAVLEQMKQEMFVFTNRPSVGKDNFEICPRRTAILALTIAENDLKKVR